MQHSWGYATERRKREENQDSFGVFTFGGYTLVVVCDGMGGHAGGAHASRLAVRTLHNFMAENLSETVAPADILRQGLQFTNQLVYEASRKNHRLMGMGTTVVAALVHEGVATIAHVGDSRCYLVRGDQAAQLTRDHTMVNLFVDAELLSPEDAATHPEAHVLSRSLGVERQVDVEVQDPFELEANDTIVLCSDGVHGFVAESEFSAINWSDPEQGVRHLLDIVSGRDGDDNATAAALRNAPGTGAPVTQLPELQSAEESFTSPNPARSGTIVPIDDEDASPYELENDTVDGGFVTVEGPAPTNSPPRATRSYDLASQIGISSPMAGQFPGASGGPSAPQSPNLYETPAATPAPQPATPQPFGAPTSSAPATSVPTVPAQPTEVPSEPNKKLIVAGIAVGGLLLVSVFGLVAIVLASQSGGPGDYTMDEPLARVLVDDGNDAPATPPAPPAPSDDRNGNPAGTDANPAGTDANPADTDANPADTDAIAGAIIDPPAPDLTATDIVVEGPDDANQRTSFFQATIPTPPRRLPNRPLQYTQPPPGGPIQFNAVQAARSRDCVATLDVVRDGMRMSIDNGVLYTQAWACFNDVHQRPLTTSTAADYNSFAALLPHLEGTDDSGEGRALYRAPNSKPYEPPMSAAEKAKYPFWYHPARGGVEYRLETWTKSTMEDRFADAMADLLGEPTVTDHLVVDLLLQAEAAVGFASLSEPDTQQITTWARRVYVFTKARNGRLGRLIKTHRPELAASLDALEAKIVRATKNDAGELEPDASVPVDVRLAWDVARGVREPPDRTKVPKVVAPSRPKEPDLGDGPKLDAPRVFR